MKLIFKYIFLYEIIVLFKDAPTKSKPVLIVVIVSLYWTLLAKNHIPKRSIIIRFFIDKFGLFEGGGRLIAKKFMNKEWRVFCCWIC